VNADDLAALERERLRALVDADVHAAMELHADDFQLITPAGTVYSKIEYLRGIVSGEISYLVWEPEEISALVRGEAGCVRYRSTIHMRFKGDEAAPGRYWHTDYYEKRESKWQVVWSQATEAASH
jgi:Domain of unknown function (DUF4440)